MLSEPRNLNYKVTCNYAYKESFPQIYCVCERHVTSERKRTSDAENKSAFDYQSKLQIFFL